LKLYNTDWLVEGDEGGGDILKPRSEGSLLLNQSGDREKIIIKQGEI